jgi:hypothetical protein
MLCEQAYDLHGQFAMFCYTLNAASEIERKHFIIKSPNELPINAKRK